MTSANRSETSLAPYITNTLFTEEIELDTVYSHAINDQPRNNISQELLVVLGPGCSRCFRLANCNLRTHITTLKHQTVWYLGICLNLYSDAVLNLWYHKETNGLAFADPSHSESALSVVSKHHVLAQSHARTSIDCLLDVHSCRMHLKTTGRLYEAIV